MEFKHNLPIAIWVLATFMITVALAIASLSFGGDPNIDPMFKAVSALALLTLAAMIGSYAYSKPCVSLWLEATGIRLVLRYPLKILRLDYRHDQVRDMRLVESKDSEGDPHFTTRITMADGRDIELAEGSREKCGPVLAQFATALRKYSQTPAYLQPTEAEHD
ncbi:MAG: hypothetical protein PHH59_04225 [Methylovulum sp.]|uniref:hypothetical protein n=1 Tax=Methylovulum sp. TaxID=1916980 RepID=UPI002610C4BE|nr:hypothetical protein [Methylovulum sp.]MDD2723216.1 hypothetical protein [Methylovulum sp.]MDD5123157.1 hypothetical protein [Methylovulum sp.]